MFLQSPVEDFTFEYPHAMVHTCSLPKNCPKITQPLIINLKTDINYERQTDVHSKGHSLSIIILFFCLR